MTMRSPVVAMLWENWRLTRLEVAWRLALGIVGGLAVLVVFAAVAPNEAVKDFGAVIALILIVLPHFVGWLSMAKLNGGRPGFPFYLLYTRPVRTAVLVGVPMAYLAASPAAIYLVSALLLRVTSGYPFPLLPVAAWIAALNLVQAATNWSTRNRVVQMLGKMVASVAWICLAVHRLTAVEIPGLRLAPESVADDVRLPAHRLRTDRRDWPGIVRCGGRRGGAAAPRRRAGGHPRTGGMRRIPGVARQPVPVPVSHLVRDAGAGVVRPEVQWTAGAGDRIGARDREPAGVRGQPFPSRSLRPIAIMWAMLSVLAVLILGGNAFGIRWRQGRVYASAFEATQPYGTARLAGLKVLVRSVCVLAALIAVGVSVWASLSFIAVGKGYEPLRSWACVRSRAPSER